MKIVDSIFSILSIKSISIIPESKAMLLSMWKGGAKPIDVENKLHCSYIYINFSWVVWRHIPNGAVKYTYRVPGSLF